MADYAQAMAAASSVTNDDAKRMGQADAAPMDDEHNNFLKTILELIDRGKINVYEPQSFLKKDVYDALDESWQDRIDLALVNIANQLQNIYLFRVSKQTPDESPILTAMIEELWTMKHRIEEHHDVFIF